jgi:ribosome-associated protein
MSKQTEAPISEIADKGLETGEDLVSKSQLKRDSLALQDLGKKLSTLNAEQLDTMPLNEKLRDAINLAQKISHKRGALKRHYQFIGKLLRSINTESIMQAVAEIEQSHNSTVQSFKALEHWRDQILENGDDVIQQYCEQHEQTDRQKLRQIWRNYQQAKDENKKTRFSRQLFRELRDNL